MDLAGRGPIGQKRQKAKPNPARIRRIKQMPCVICGKPGPSDAHHCICGRYGQRKDDDDHTIPLCKQCHQWGSGAIHNGKASWVKRHGPDYDYLPIVNRMLKADEEDWI